jgi:hypothetical protein
MTLREQFENEIKSDKGGVSVSFEARNQQYIKWLEDKVQSLSTDRQSIITKEEIFKAEKMLSKIQELNIALQELREKNIRSHETYLMAIR